MFDTKEVTGSMYLEWPLKKRYKLTSRETLVLENWFQVKGNRNLVAGNWGGLFESLVIATRLYLTMYKKGSASGTVADFEEVERDSYFTYFYLNTQEESSAPFRTIETATGWVYNYDSEGNCIGETK